MVLQKCNSPLPISQTRFSSADGDEHTGYMESPFAVRTTKATVKPTLPHATDKFSLVSSKAYISRPGLREKSVPEKVENPRPKPPKMNTMK
jgi:hypothetical protein